MIKTKDGFRLTTGREFYANRNLLSIGIFDVHPGETDEYEGWTPAEKAELADYMIAPWAQFEAESQS